MPHGLALGIARRTFLHGTDEEKETRKEIQKIKKEKGFFSERFSRYEIVGKKRKGEPWCKENWLL